MADFDVGEEMQKLVASKGDSVGINSGDCILWKADHKNCSGCPHELGCGKTVHLMAIMLIPRMYEPKDYNDYAQMQNRIQDLMDKTLEAKTIEELHLVPHQ